MAPSKFLLINEDVESLSSCSDRKGTAFSSCFSSLVLSNFVFSGLLLKFLSFNSGKASKNKQ